MKIEAKIAVLGFGIGLVGLAGCASVPPPNEQMAFSQAAVAKAEDAQAYQYAPVAFNNAQEKLSRAKAAMSKEDYLTARRLAEQAEVDANLAYTKARTAQAQRAVQELQQTIKTLRQELERSS